MSDIGALHESAMDLAELALVANTRGADAEAASLSRRAFEMEREAALAAAADSTPEPTRSVLLRRAASMALDCGETREDGVTEPVRVPPELMNDIVRRMGDEVVTIVGLKTAGCIELVDISPADSATG